MVFFYMNINIDKHKYYGYKLKNINRILQTKLEG